MSETVHEAQVAEVDKMVAGKTVLSFQLPTPKWATIIFRTEFILNKALMFWMSGTSIIPPEKVKEYILILGAVDLVVWFFGRSIGIKKDDVEKDLGV